MMIKTSVLIITRNRSQIIGQCLDALRPQIDAMRHEVIVVDSSEKGDTARLMKDYPWAIYYRIELPLGTRPQSYTFGAQQSRGEIIALLDDDAIVFPGWLEALEKCYESPFVGGAGGRVLPKDWDRKADDRKKKVEDGEQKSDIRLKPSELNPLAVEINRVHMTGIITSRLYLDPGHRVEVDTLRGCNMSLRKDLLVKVGYFDERFRGQNCRVEDDPCIGIKGLGHKIIFEPKAVVCHLAEERPDIPRSEYNSRSEFYVWRNTVWLYIKHFGWDWKMIFRASFWTPLKICFRRVVGGSFKKPRVTLQTLRYLPASCAGIFGGLWGIGMSFCYKVRDRLRFGRKAAAVKILEVRDNRKPIEATHLPASK